MVFRLFCNAETRYAQHMFSKSCHLCQGLRPVLMANEALSGLGLWSSASRENATVAQDVGCYPICDRLQLGVSLPDVWKYHCLPGPICQTASMWLSALVTLLGFAY